MRDVLVTGGSGFFGIELIRVLLERGYRVKNLDIEAPKDHKVESGTEFIRADLRDNKTVSSACENVDFIFHNAAVLPISRSKKKFFWEVNVGGTRNVLEAAFKAQVKKVIFISSSAPYGMPKEFPITERTKFAPVCDYGRSKIAAEEVCYEYRKKGLDVVILRPRTIVGRGRLGLFQILYSWIADNKNIYIIGKGDNLFQLLGDKDLATACLLCIERNPKNEDFNLGTDRYRTVRKDLEALIEHAGSRSRLISLPTKLAKAILGILDFLNVSPLTPWHYKTPDKPFYFDISKAKNMLGWQPEMGNLDMLKDSYDWYLARREKIDSEFGTTHRKAVRQRILRGLKGVS